MTIQITSNSESLQGLASSLSDLHFSLFVLIVFVGVPILTMILSSMLRRRRERERGNKKRKENPFDYESQWRKDDRLEMQVAARSAEVRSAQRSSRRVSNSHRSTYDDDSSFVASSISSFGSSRSNSGSSGDSGFSSGASDSGGSSCSSGGGCD
mgnify:CR=1 FL=1|tara:strand:- start:1036 stop:1497 length:462 start_codon:yes stop_codon:yes gene_type:complete